MEEEELLRAMSLIMLLAVAVHANELDDLIKSQETIVPKHLPAAKKFMQQANKNATTYQAAATKIINDSKANVKKDFNLDWLDGLTVKQDLKAVFKPELYIFVSLSIPRTRLIEILIDATHYKAVVVLRGLKNNSYKDTAKFVQPIIKKAGVGFIIDPTLFSKYNVTQVPAFVLHDPSIKKYDQITGNITLPYALEEFAKNGDLQEEAANRLKAHT